MKEVFAGQRWVSDGEPELGLGIVLKAECGRVELFFPAANEHRQYALETAPLRRVRFGPGDKIKTHDGEQFAVDTVEERAGLLIYRDASGQQIAEAELSDTISFSRPEDRLFAGQVDGPEVFELRVEALKWRAFLQQSQTRGFVGGRVELLPHQIFIASEVAGRLLPRVLLADEVGLGKTIEACLILHRLHLTGRAGRVLVLVPEPLMHQWFVELLRRFNLLFSIFDEARCEAIEREEGANPFLDSQLVLCSVEFLAGNPGRARQAIEAGWELLVVDEAHHLQWHPGQPSAEYLLVEALASGRGEEKPGVLLLSATPQQLGPEGHFARLRLLDPDRYSDLNKFLAESEHYEEVAKLVDSPGPNSKTTSLAGTEGVSVQLLLDAFGMGRVMFRNTRAALGGFPLRQSRLVALEGKKPLDLKIKWLAELLKELGESKVLLICHTREMAELISDKLQRVVKLKVALFHEDLTLMQRDRNAAYFAEEDGARLLICSEIGSEGRNFQFAHHLVLFDLPEGPEVLEQRIGRLDRIGQKKPIQIHVPYVRGEASEVLAHWYQEGLNAFEHNPHGAAEIASLFKADIQELCATYNQGGVERLIARTRQRLGEITRKLERGHDRLLALTSSKPEMAARVIEQIQHADGDTGFEEFVLSLFGHFGVHCEDLGNRSHLLLPGHLLTDAFPALPEGGLSVTFDRLRALSREDIGFMTGDHPMVRGALDLLLGGEMGNSCFGVWKSPGPEAILLEVHVVAECVARAGLHVERFLPVTPIRIVVDHALEDRTETIPDMHPEKGDVFRLLDRGVVKKKLLPAMLLKAEEIASQRTADLVQKACAKAEAHLQGEIERLVLLAKVNDHVHPLEIQAMQKLKQELLEAIGGARVRVDTLRLVMKTAN